MFKTPASRVPTGNYLVEATCQGPLRHTVYKNQMSPNGPYKCPYPGCGHDVS